MPRLTNAVPKYRKHRATSQAIVTLDGRDFYLGRHGTPESVAAYQRITSEWVAGGRTGVATTDRLTVTELCCAYWNQHAKTYYRPKTIPGVKRSLHFLKELYGNVDVDRYRQ